MKQMDQRFHKDPEARTSTAQKDTPRRVFTCEVRSLFKTHFQGQPSPCSLTCREVVHFECLGMRSFQMKLLFLLAVSNKICYQRLVSLQF